jgi:hypothetical protein
MYITLVNIEEHIFSVFCSRYTMVWHTSTFIDGDTLDEDYKFRTPEVEE